MFWEFWSKTPKWGFSEEEVPTPNFFFIDFLDELGNFKQKNFCTNGRIFLGVE